jgi:hypothetical protein
VTWQELTAFSTGTLAPQVSFSPDGRMLTAGGWMNSQRIQVLRAPTFEEIAAAEAQQLGSSLNPRNDPYDDSQP